MLVELYIKNLAVIEETRITFHPGLTALSGEEGAGKSLIVDALCLLVGGRASTTLIRSGAASALVEGAFWLPPDDASLSQTLHQAGIEIEADGYAVLSREVLEQGRSIARINGRPVPVSLLRDVGQRLMDIHSQMEHVSLLSPVRQLDILDTYAGLLGRRSDLAGRVVELREKARELDHLCGEDAQRRRELLEYQVSEIDAADVHGSEDEDLQQERQVLLRAQTLREDCYAAYQKLYADDRSAASLVYCAARALQGALSIDPSLRPHLDALESAGAELEQTARELRSHADSVVSRADRLDQIEERLELLRRLKGKYGPSLEDVAGFADRIRRELEAFQEEEAQRCSLEEHCSKLRAVVQEQALGLSEARQASAQHLTELVNGELADLGMPWAKFDISLTREERRGDPPASEAELVCGERGFDRIEFLAATNPGEPLRPLAEIASGGETARFMLALKGSLQRADGTPLLVFDEIDMGIGGRSAHIVGKRLASLACDRQVLCVTHLPQIACFAENHYRVVKDVASGQASTRIEHLEGGSRVEELAFMLGSESGSHMLRSAEQLLKQAARRSDRVAAAVSCN